MSAIEILLLVAVLLILACVACLAWNVHVIRSELLQDIRSILLRGSGPGWPGAHIPHDGLRHIPHPFYGYFTVWEWRGGKWRLTRGSLPPGAEPGAPPSHPGAFSGDVVKQWVPRSRP